MTIKGRTVSVRLRARDSRDTFGNDVESYSEPQEVGNVLVQPGECEELASTRPEGVRVAFTLHFPKAFSGDLRGALVELPEPWGYWSPSVVATTTTEATTTTATSSEPVPSRAYRVIGDPKPYMVENCPTDWYMPVEVEAVDG